MRKPRPRNSTRDRDVAELSLLRRLVHDLEAQVVKLSNDQLQPSQSLESAWRFLSERQARARQVVERKNRELNERVQCNADWIQRLWELLCEKRRAVKTTTFVRTAVQQQRADDYYVIQHLKKKTKQAAQQMADIFAMHGIQVSGESCGGGDMHKEQWSHEKAGDLDSTLVCMRRIPFDVHSTSASLWTALSCPERSFASESNSLDSSVGLRVMERAPTECAMKFRNSHQIDNELTSASYYAVVQRMTKLESQRIDVFVWQSLFTVDNDNAKHTNTMWATVVRCPSRSLESVVAVVCQSHIGLAPGPDAATMQTSSMAMVESCIGSILSSVENTLLDERLRSIEHANNSIQSGRALSFDV